ncbi:lamprin 0.9-like isoform X1 [Lethenteron reissneri]|uniref:lamprin 0.9-like isoform X1 n=1 Tax=Lethenteron reissneri TaxID=7753 RepID=UPI002AB7EFA8|nr:lamprin 0.9-like isoform X1 [Lethenteron reissneri]XP_061403304.1 lamprin 0.9-like isoform X1 [Lethenteron reissneri]
MATTAMQALLVLALLHLATATPVIGKQKVSTFNTGYLGHPLGGLGYGGLGYYPGVAIAGAYKHHAAAGLVHPYGGLGYYGAPYHHALGGFGYPLGIGAGVVAPHVVNSKLGAVYAGAPFAPVV